MSVITDGTGTGNKAKVTADNQLTTAAVTRTFSQQATADGDGFNIATPRVTLTSTNESALFYIQNLEDTDLLISALIINTTASTGTLTGQPEVKVYRNPVSGTLISSPGAIISTNLNYGSSQTLNANQFSGIEGSTIAGQSAIIDIPLASRAAVPLNILSTDVILPKGTAYAVTYKPETGSTSVDVIIAILATRFKSI